MSQPQPHLFDAIREIEVKYVKNNTVTLQNVPYHFLSHLLTCSSLYNHMAVTNEKLSAEITGQDTDSENLIYVETHGRALRYLDELIKSKAFNKDMDSYADEQATAKSLKHWLDSNEQYRALLHEKSKLPAIPSSEPARSLATARMHSIEVIRYIGYVSNGIRGMLADNWHNRPSEHLKYLKQIRSYVNMMIRLLEKVVRIREQATPKKSDGINQHPLERAI